MLINLNPSAPLLGSKSQGVNLVLTITPLFGLFSCTKLCSISLSNTVSFFVIFTPLLHFQICPRLCLDSRGHNYPESLSNCLISTNVVLIYLIFFSWCGVLLCISDKISSSYHLSLQKDGCSKDHNSYLDAKVSYPVFVLLIVLVACYHGMMQTKWLHILITLFY